MGERATSEHGPAPRAPERITCLLGSRALELDFGEQGRFRIPFSELRAASPAAGGAKDPKDCVDVTVTAIGQVGNYAIQPAFSDGHDSGIYTWAHLASLCRKNGERL